MRASVLALSAGLLVLAGQSGAQETRRELGPHVHGTGRLDIVIDGNKLALDLDAPAHDIIGFEHAPGTPEQQAALDKATAALNDAASLFSPSSEAGCKLVKANAGLEQPEPADNSAKKPSGEQHAHADINGSFEFECADITRLKAIKLGYFAAFPGAGKLEITISGPKSQATREATRGSPTIDLAGLN